MLVILGSMKYENGLLRRYDILESNVFKSVDKREINEVMNRGVFICRY
jgi:hypothetical protein